MPYRLACLAALLVVLGGFPEFSVAQTGVDHTKTAFPLKGKHKKVSCESCHPPSGATRKWKGVPLECSGCHSDRRSHRGGLGDECQLCHAPKGWTSISKSKKQHKFKLTGNHNRDCVACHKGGANLTPKVPGCEGCHQLPHRAQEFDCTTCHDLKRWDSVSFEHKVDPRKLGGRHRTATCLDCHKDYRFSDKTMQCKSCHRSKQPHEFVGACNSCHSTKTWQELELKKTSTKAPSPFAVTDVFDHIQHGRTTVKAGLGAKCADCHPKNQPRQAPAMINCETCHDGKKAFPALGTQCGKCHPAPADLASRPKVEPQAFMHDLHATFTPTAKCNACHPVALDAKALRAGGAEHELCVNCHAQEFRKARTIFCGTCHERNDPYQPNPIRRPVDAPKQFKTAHIPHKPHIAVNLSCEGCHIEEANLSKKDELTPSHEACGRCHKPEMPGRLGFGECDACHVPIDTPKRVIPRRPWSTRDTFVHAGWHRKATCKGCHLPEGADDVAPPTMKGCESCHDGDKAFKTTGFGCVRCHETTESTKGPQSPSPNEK